MTKKTETERAIIVFKKLSKAQHEELDLFFQTVVGHIAETQKTFAPKNSRQYIASSCYPIGKRYFKLKISFTMFPVNVIKNEIIEIKKREYEQIVSEMAPGHSYFLNNEN